VILVIVIVVALTSNDQSKVIEQRARRAHQDEKAERLAEQRETARAMPWWRQPTIGDAIRASRQK
jgi:hypothetical protein